MVEQTYVRAEDMVKAEQSVKKEKKMVVKINKRPIKVEEEEEKSFSWMYLTVSTIGYAMCFYLMDFVAFTFLGIHPFPWIKFIGVILSWFG